MRHGLIYYVGQDPETINHAVATLTQFRAVIIAVRVLRFEGLDLQFLS